MNCVILVGNIIRNEKLIINDKDASKGCIAVRRDFKNKDGEYDSDLINYVAYDSNAKFINDYAPVGSTVSMRGRWQHRSYQDQQGNNKYIDELIIDKVVMLKKKETAEENKNEFKPKNEYEALKRAEKNEPLPSVDEDDLPF